MRKNISDVGLDDVMCLTCVFYEASNDSSTGFCRRHAPRPLGDEPRSREVFSQADWPRVIAQEDWCGEWLEHRTRVKDLTILRNPHLSGGADA